jgi:hypothetical protein
MGTILGRYPSIQESIPEADKILDTVGARAGDLLGLLYKSSFRIVGGLFGSVFAVLLLVFVLINPRPLVARVVGGALCSAGGNQCSGTLHPR